MSPASNARSAALEALIDSHAVELKLPTLRRQFSLSSRTGNPRAADPGRISRSPAGGRERRPG